MVTLDYGKMSSTFERKGGGCRKISAVAVRGMMRMLKHSTVTHMEAKASQELNNQREELSQSASCHESRVVYVQVNYLIR